MKRYTTKEMSSANAVRFSLYAETVTKKCCKIEKEGNGVKVSLDVEKEEDLKKLQEKEKELVHAS